MASFTDIFIRRPVLASVVSLLILLVGVQAALKLQIRQYPELSQTTITITTSYPGADADLIKGFITTPIEQAVASTEGIDTISSTSVQDVSTVTLNMVLNANPDRAMTDVLSKLNQVRSVLPKDALDPVVVKQSGQGFSLMYMSFVSDTLTAPQMADFLARVVQPRLQTIDGVGNAQIFGDTLAMRVWLDPNRMASHGVTPADVSQALTSNNFTSAAGQIKGAYTQTSVAADTSLDTPDAFKQLVVSSHGDALVRLGAIADVDLGPASVSNSTEFDGTRGVFMAIDPTPTANPLDVIDRIRAAVPDIQSQLPPGITMSIAYDASQFIRSSIFEVAKTLGEAAIIVIVIIFLFLGNLRSTLIPIVTIPLSLVGVMIMLLALGYSINLLTLLALVLAIGLVVDDAIVVVENIYRHIEEGMTPFDAAIQGAREITGPIISMTITLAAVYAPIGFVSGLTGALFREFAFTLAGSVIVSGFIALTLSPMMCSRLLKPPSTTGGGFVRFLDRLFEGLRNRYQRLLHRTLNFRALTVLILLGVLVLTGIMYVTTPNELAPDEDQGVLFGIVKAPQYSNLDYLENTTAAIDKVLATIPEKAHVFAINGYPDIHQGFIGVILKDWSERTRSQKQVLQTLQGKFATIAGAQVLAFSPPSLPGSTGGPPLQFVVRTTGDYQDLAGVIAKLQQAAQASGLFIFTDTDLKFDTPQYDLHIDATKANSLGISLQDIGTSLATLLGGNYVNRFNLYGRSYEVIPQAPRKFRDVSDWLTRYQVRAKNGALVPLSTVASVTLSVQPNALTNFQQLSSATLSGVPFPGHTLGEGVDFLKKQAAAIFPPGYSYDFQGDSRQYVQEGNTLAVTFVFALIVIFLVLAAQFESFRDPFIILIALPTSMFGALLPLNILGVMGAASINIYTQIGLVTLIGLISKHGILMVEFANRSQEQGMSRREAIERAAAVRLRPILMTTAAMVVAMIPLITANGAGAASRFDIGIVIAFGMSIGTMFTLFVTPAVYTLIARDHRLASSKVAARPPAPPARLAPEAAAE